MARTVLVADDNLTIQRMAVEMLAQEGVEVVTVANGMAAIKKLPMVKPLVVLADADMPGRDGYEVCDFVKSSPDFGHVQAFLVVGDEDLYDEARGVHAHIDGVIKKPFDREQLIATVVKCLDRAATLAPAPAEVADGEAEIEDAPASAQSEFQPMQPAEIAQRLEEWHPETADSAAIDCGSQSSTLREESATNSEAIFEAARSAPWSAQEIPPPDAEKIPEAALFSEPGTEAESPDESARPLSGEPHGAAPGVDRTLVASIVSKVIARTSPSVFSPEMIRELERTLTEQIVSELSSHPVES